MDRPNKSKSLSGDAVVSSLSAGDLAARTVSPALAVLFFVYLALALLDLSGPWITGAPTAPRAAFFAACAAGTLCAGGWFATRDRVLPAAWANPVLASLSLLMTVTSSNYLLLVPDPVHTANHILTSIAIGLVMISRLWVAIALAGVVVGWALAATAGPMDSQWFHWGAMLVISQLLAVGLHEFRLRTTLRLLAHRELTEERLLEAQRKAARREAADTQEKQVLEARLEEIRGALKESQQIIIAKEPLAAVGTLSAGIAHQIKNPVGTILNSASYALLDHEDEESVRIAALRDIRESAVRCGKILKNVLSFSRSEAEEMCLEDLDGLIIMAVNVTASAARERRSECEIRLAPDKPRIPANPIALEEVFVNLIQNAIESKPAGSRVRISTRRLAGEIEIAVEDDGPGIPTDAAKHVFEVLYTTKSGQGGAGLGLSVARRIVDEHRGRVLLSSPENDELHAKRLPGACFLVRLPSS